MVRLPILVVVCATTACSAGELGALTGDNDATASNDASFATDTARADQGLAVEDSSTPPLDGTVPVDSTPPPFDGAPADLGGDGGCTFGGTSIASAIVTTEVASASPTGDALLAERPGGLAVAWRSSAGWRVTPLDATGARAGSDLPIDGVLKVYGIASGADGYAILASRAPDYMTFLRISGAGAVVARHDLVGGGDHMTVGTEWFGEFANTGRLIATATGFAAYFGIHRRWPDGIGHQGDTLRLFTSAGATAGSMWGWGCSHSLDQRIDWNGTKVGALCLSDCYPKKAIMLNHNETTVSDEPSGNCAGSVNASLGAVVGDPAGFFALVLSREGRSSTDVKLVRIGNDAAVKSTSWLTTTTADESDGHLARFGGAMLAGWSGGGRYLARIDNSGAIVGAPETTTAPSPAHDFVGLVSGDAAWASTDGGKLTIVRVRACP